VSQGTSNDGTGRDGVFELGERVRVVASGSPYTGCRGSVAESPYPVPAGEAGVPLGYYVAVDGENGRARPFLAEELERVRVARVRPPDPEAPRRLQRDAQGS
jgi:hypothetical protein